MACPDDNALASFLDGGGSRSQRPGGLQAHVAACVRCQTTFALLAGASSSGTGSVPSNRDSALARSTGERIGRYAIVRRIGAGASGVVYAAHDPELGRDVALKLLRSGGTQQARLAQEGRTLARLSHPNIVTVFEVGTVHDEVFIALELVVGATLRRWNESHRAAAEVLGMFVQAGHGLAAAHDAGVVHRDFKPDNVLVGEDGRVRVVDFGLAMSTSSDPAEHAGFVVGTPAYMAPEQHGGGRADARSDQYAFCVSLHEALFGARPGARSDTSERALPNWATRSERRAIVRVLQRGLRRDPAERFESMNALLAALADTRSTSTVRVMFGIVAALGVVACVLALWPRPEPIARMVLPVNSGVAERASAAAIPTPRPPPPAPSVAAAPPLPAVPRLRVSSAPPPAPAPEAPTVARDLFSDPR